MTTISCVGIAVHDIILPLTKLPSGPGKNHTESRIEVGGGVAANAAVAIARLGGDVRLHSALGNDLVGRRILHDLAEEGVDVSGVRALDELASPLSAVIVDENGERMIINHTDPSLFQEAAIPTAEDLDDSEAVLCDVRWPKAAEVALRWAREREVPGVVDFDVGNRPVEHLLDIASHVVFSSDALRDLTGEADPEKGLRSAAERTGAWLAVTVGSDGTVWLEDGSVRSRPAFDVDVIDTTGAGDAYHGAFTLAVAEARSVIESIRFASAAAALTCTAFGGRSGIPGRREVERLMSTQP